MILTPNLTTGLVLWLGCNVSGTTTYDLSGNGNNGTLVGTPGQQRYLSRKGFTFNGSSQYITLSSNSALNLGTFTFSCFINPNSTQVAYADIIDMGHYDTGPSTYGWALEQDNVSHNTYNIYISDQSSGDGDILGQFTLTANIWQLLTFVFNGSTNTGYIYINGRLMVSGTRTGGPLQYSSYYKLLGAWNNNNGTATRFFNGKISNILYYNRVLNGTEIQQLYYQTFGLQLL